MGERFSITRPSQPNENAEAAHRHWTAPEAPVRPQTTVADGDSALRRSTIGTTEQFPKNQTAASPDLNIQPGAGAPLTFKNQTSDLFSPRPINVDQLSRKFDLRISTTTSLNPAHSPDINVVRPHSWPSALPRIHREPPPETGELHTGEPIRHHVSNPVARRHPDANPTAAPTATPFLPPTEGGGNPTPKPSQPPTEVGNPTPKPTPKASAPPTEGGNPSPKPSPPPTEGGHLKPGPPLRYAPPAELHIWHQQFPSPVFSTAESSTWVKITDLFPAPVKPKNSDVCSPCSIPCLSALPKHEEPRHKIVPAHHNSPKSVYHDLPLVPHEHHLPFHEPTMPSVTAKKGEHLIPPKHSPETMMLAPHAPLQRLAPSEPNHHSVVPVEHKLPHIVVHHTPISAHTPKHKPSSQANPDCPSPATTPAVQPLQTVEVHTSKTVEHHVKKGSGIYTDLTLNSDGTSNITIGKWLDRKNYVNVSVDAGPQGLGNTRLTAGHALIPAYNADGTPTKGTLNVEGSAIIETGRSYSSSQLPVDGGAGAGVSVNGYRSVSADNNTKIYGSADYVQTSQVHNETDTQVGVSRTIGHVPVSLGIEHTTVSDYHPANYIQAGTSIDLDKSGTKQFFLNATKSLNTGKTTVWGGVSISIR